MKEALALLINDIHVDRDNIAEFNKNWDEALTVCQREGITDIVVGGDVFISRASQTLATLLAVRHALDRAVLNGIYVTIAEGNHDLVNQEDIEGYNHLWKGLEGIEVIDSHKYLYWSGCDFALLVMSYFPEKGSFLDRLERAVSNTIIDLGPEVDSEAKIVLYVHEGIHGALGDYEIDGELPQEPFKEFKAVLCGHYHNRTKIKGTNIRYIGSSRQHNFGEDEEKGYTILYSDGSTSFVKNEVNTRYITCEVDASDIDNLENYFSDHDLSNYKTKVKVRCNEKQAKTFDKQKLIDLGFNKVEMIAESKVSKDIASVGIDEKYDKQGIKKEYLSFCEEQDIDSELGIKYLEA